MSSRSVKLFSIPLLTFLPWTFSLPPPPFCTNTKGMRDFGKPRHTSWEQKLLKIGQSWHNSQSYVLFCSLSGGKVFFPIPVHQRALTGSHGVLAQRWFPRGHSMPLEEGEQGFPRRKHIPWNLTLSQQLPFLFFEYFTSRHYPEPLWFPLWSLVLSQGPIFSRNGWRNGFQHSKFQSHLHCFLGLRPFSSLLSDSNLHFHICNWRQ